MNQRGVQFQQLFLGVFLRLFDRLARDGDGYLAVADLLEEVVYAEGLDDVLWGQVRHLADLHDVERFALVGVKELHEHLRPVRNVAQLPKVRKRFFRGSYLILDL